MRLANKYRPVRFEQVVGQREQVAIISAILTKGWVPPSIMALGPYGTGKTTLARLIARALLCTDLEQGPTSPEPCGTCDACRAMDARNHPDYTEIDAASNGSVADVRAIREDLGYRTTSGKRIICFDECHMLTSAGQNALLQVLEEGIRGVVFLFCTTDPQKMLPTIRSRSVELRLRLLKAPEIGERLQAVARAEGIPAEDSAIRLISTYCRGHVRDALGLLEQLAQVGGATEDRARAYLRLEVRDDAYKLLTLTDQGARLDYIEELLCKYAPRELAEAVGGALFDAYKVATGGGASFSEADRGWLKRVLDATPRASLLPAAERLLMLPAELSTIQAAAAALVRCLHAADGPAAGSVPFDLRKSET